MALYTHYFSKFKSKTEKIKSSSPFYKHLKNSHKDNSDQEFKECFEVKIVKAYQKPLTRQTEEGTLIINTKGDLLNSKSEWHQPKIIRTTINTGGAELAGRRYNCFQMDGNSGPLESENTSREASSNRINENQ